MKYDMQRRFAFIETRLLFGDGVTASDVAQTFGLARQNAQQTVTLYRENHPGQMRYDKKRRRHVKTDWFRPAFIDGDVGKFLDYQRAASQIAYFFDDPDWADLPFSDAERLVRRLYAGDAVKTVLAALRRKLAVEMEYWARSGARLRQVSPHHLIFADGRYHVRGYCHTKAAFRDFVLSRIVHAAHSDLPWVSDAEDHDWNQITELCFKINPALPNAARNALRLDYLRQGEEVLVIRNVRRALATYVKRRLTRPDFRYGVPRWLHQELGAASAV